MSNRINEKIVYLVFRFPPLVRQIGLRWIVPSLPIVHAQNDPRMRFSVRLVSSLIAKTSKADVVKDSSLCVAITDQEGSPSDKELILYRDRT